MMELEEKALFVQERYEIAYQQADHRIWQLAFASAALLLVEGLVYDQFFLALAGSLLNLSCLFLVSHFVQLRKIKNLLIGAALFMWPVLMVLLSEQVAGVHFLLCCYIFILAFYQDPGLVIKLSMFAATLVLAYSLPVILGLSAEDFLLFSFIGVVDITWEKMIVILIVLAITATLTTWIALVLHSRLLADTENEFLLMKSQRMLEKNKEFAAKMTKGDFSLSLDQSQERDELTEALEEMRENLKAAAEKEQQDRFTNLGLSEISEILRKNSNSLQNLTDGVLRHLVKYLGINQGGLFLLEGEAEDKKLVLSSCYAFDKKKFQEKEVAVGQGMLGQLVLEKESIILTDVPDDYINITSGLGEANPSCILLVPLIVNEVVHGALELASFHKMEDYKIAFTEKVAVSIASAVAAAKVNGHTKKLLAEAQEQAEQLRSQEEEMRQNMEELNATQEEMMRKSNELESRIMAINASGIAAIEYELDGTIITVNEAFMNLMEYSLEEVVGKHHRIFVNSEFASSQEYSEMWTNLANGTKIEGELERYTKSGKRVYTKGAYTSIRDMNGRPIRIINLVTDITATKNLIIEAQQQTMQIVEQENEIRKSLETMQELQKESDKRMMEMNYYLEAINTSMITMEINTDGQILEANDALLEILKYDADSLKTRVHADLMHPEDLQHQQYQQLWVQLQEGQNTQITMRRLTSDNEVRWFRSYYFPKQEEDGTIYKIIELSYDFTLEKIQEDKIINNEKILHERVKSIEDKAYNRIVKLKQEMKTKLAEKDELIANLEKK